MKPLSAALLALAVLLAASRVRAAETLDLTRPQDSPTELDAGPLKDYRLYEKGGLGVYYRRVRPGTMPFLRYRADTINLPLREESFRVGAGRSDFYNQPGLSRRLLRRGDFFYHRAGQVRGGWIAESSGTFDALLVSFPPAASETVAPDAARSALPDRSGAGRFFAASDGLARVDASAGSARRSTLLDGALRVVLLRFAAPAEVRADGESPAVLFAVRGAARSLSAARPLRIGVDAACVLAPGESLRVEPDAGEPFYGLLITRARGTR